MGKGASLVPWPQVVIIPYSLSLFCSVKLYGLLTSALKHEDLLSVSSKVLRFKCPVRMVGLFSVLVWFFAEGCDIRSKNKKKSILLRGWPFSSVAL